MIAVLPLLAISPDIPLLGACFTAPLIVTLATQPLDRLADAAEAAGGGIVQ